MSYIEGPTDQAWEVAEDGDDGWMVQRVHFWQRNREVPVDAPMEAIWVFLNERAAQELATRLNELDRLRRIEALALDWHHAILATNGVYDAEQSLRAALIPQEPTQ